MAEVETALVLRMEATLAKFEKQMARARKAGRDTSVGLEKQFANSNKSMAKSAENSAMAIGREMDRLRAKYDPLFAASKRYEAELDELNRAHKVGALNANQYDHALEALNAKFTRATSGAERLAGATRKTSGVMRGMGGGIQNVAFQVGDFATQVGAATPASIALGQQLPQLLGGFGVLGAVMGAVAAIGIPLASAFMDSSEEAKTLSDRLNELEQAVAAYRQAVDQAIIPTADLVEKYGTATAAAREFINALREVAQVNASEKLSQEIELLIGQFGRLEGAATTAGARAGVSALDQYVRELGDALELTEDDANRVASAMQALANAEGPRAQASAAADLLAVLEQVLGTYSGMNAAQRELYDTVVQIGEGAADMAGGIEQAAAATQGLVQAAYAAAQGFWSAAPAVDTLLGKVQALASAAWDYAGALGRAQIEYNKSIGGGRGGDPRQFTHLDEFREQLKRQRSSPKRSGARRSSGGSGSSGRGGGGAKQPDLFEATEKELTKLERKIEMIGMEADQVAALEAKYKLLDEAKKRGLDLDARQAKTGETLAEQIERQSQAIGDLTRKYEQAKERADFFNQAQEDFKNGMLDAIIEGENLAGVLEDLAKAFARAALEAALFGEGPFSGSSGGGLASIFGALFNAKGNAFGASGQVVPFANGGVVNSPTMFNMRGARMGVMGEAGPEAIMPLSRMANGKLGVQADAGAQRVDVRVFMDENGNWQSRVERIAQGEASNTLATYDAGFEGRMHGSLRQGRNKRLNRSWGGR